MAEEKHSTSNFKIIWLVGGLIILAIAAAAIYFAITFQDLKSKNTERQTFKTNAIKGEVWMERADKAHDAGNHDAEFEFLLKSAKFNYIPAIFKISKNYETGNYVHQSDLKAQEWAAKLPKHEYIKFLYRRGFSLTDSSKSVSVQSTGLDFLEEGVSISPDNETKKHMQKRAAWVYSQGNEALRDQARARDLFEEIGGKDLQNFLGTSGFNLEQSGKTEEARKFYQEAIEQGSDRAKVSLAHNYLNNWEDESGREKAINLFRDVIISDDLNSRHEAALFFMERGPQDNIALGLNTMTALADEGFSKSQLYMIKYYTDNPDVMPDYEQAVKYLESLTYMPAMAKVTLAHLKRTGLGTSKDVQAAFKLYQDAANDSYDPAKFALAHMHRLGLGTPKDAQKAQALYESLRYDERHAASYYIGLLYEDGDLGPADIKKAIKLYNLAAEAEYAPAFMRLAAFYEAGNYVTKDTDKAFKLMTEAGYSAHPNALESMARYYTEGIGTEASAEYARIWRNKKVANSPFAFD